MKLVKIGTAGAVCALAVTMGATAGASSAKKLTGKPIQIMGYGTFAATQNAYPQMQVGIQSAVDAVNAAGGINGRPLKVGFCNDQADPNVAQSCAEKAVSNKDVAVVTGTSALENSVIPTLQQHDISFVGNITNSIYDATSPISFPSAPGAYNGNGADGIAAKAARCKRAVAVTVIVPGETAEIESTVLSGLKRAKIPVLKTLNVSLSATSFASVVAAATAEHADCLVSVLSESETTALMSQAKQTGNGIKVFMPSVNTAPLNTLAGVGNGDYIFAFSPVPGESPEPSGLATVTKDIKKYGGSNTSIAPSSFGGFAGVLLVADALKTIKSGPINAKTTLKALDHLKNASTDGILPPYTVKPTGIKHESREFNPDAIAFKIEGTKAIPASKFEPIPGI